MAEYTLLKGVNDSEADARRWELLRAAERANSLGISTHTVKFYVDGVIPQKTAFMLARYENSGDERGTLGESKESYKVKTYGRVVAITRQTLIAIRRRLDLLVNLPPGQLERMKLQASARALGRDG